MNLLLDTQVMLWWRAGDARLRPALRRRIEAASTHLWVSRISLWEIVVKQSIGKLELDVSIETFEQGLERASVRMLGLENRHLQRCATLPLLHRDPFDRLLIAQALAHELVVATSDRAWEPYPVRIHWT